MQRPHGSFQELSGHCIAGSDGESSTRQRCRAWQGPAPGGRHCLLHTFFIWLIQTHSLGLSSGIPFQEAFSALCRLSEACVLSLNKKKYLKLRNKEKQWHFHSLPYCGIVLKGPRKGLVNSMGNILEFDFAL